MLPSVLKDDASERHSYFADAWQRLRTAELLFLDPDNGLEVQSVGYGRTTSAKYLYWREVEEAYGRGHSLVIYQHFRRQRRETFVTGVADELGHRLGGSRVEPVQTAKVVFLAAVRPEHSEPFQKARELVMRRWNGQIH